MNIALPHQRRTLAEDLRAALTTMTGASRIDAPTPPRADEADLLAALGYQYGLRPTPPVGSLDVPTEQAVAKAYADVPGLLARGQAAMAFDRLR